MAKKWNINEYDINNNIIYKLINGECYLKEYDKYSKKLKFEGEYLNGEKNGNGKE